MSHYVGLRNCWGGGNARTALTAINHSSGTSDASQDKVNDDS